MENKDVKPYDNGPSFKLNINDFFVGTEPKSWEEYFKAIDSLCTNIIANSGFLIDCLKQENDPLLSFSETNLNKLQSLSKDSLQRYFLENNGEKENFYQNLFNVSKAVDRLGKETFSMQYLSFDYVKEHPDFLEIEACLKDCIDTYNKANTTN